MSSYSSGFIPGSGLVAEPGLRSVAPGSGLINMPPVSVCHQVSTMGQRPSPTTRWYLIALADAISHGKGFLTVATILPKRVSDAERVKGLRESIRTYLKKRRVPALVKVQTAENVFEGAQALVRTYGFGPIVPNTILIGETEQSSHLVNDITLVAHH